MISVGNLTVGGTGKTPFLIYLLKLLSAQSKAVAVLTRGYRGNATDGNEETALVRTRFPAVAVGVGADRWAAAQQLLARQPIDAFLLDDGFQHWPLARDLDFVCIDATDPWGGGWLLPAGRLREPRSALRRADAVVINRLDVVAPERRGSVIDKIEAATFGLPIFVSESQYQWVNADGVTRSPVELREREVIALSAIGNPSAFEATLTRFGAQVHSARFRDHHAYTRAELLKFRQKARERNAIIVTTEKDWVKIEPLLSDRADWSVLHMNLAFAPAEESRLETLIKRAFA